MLDGVYRCGADGTPTLIEAAASTDEECHALLQTVIALFMKMLSRGPVQVRRRRKSDLGCANTQTCPEDASGDLRAAQSITYIRPNGLFEEGLMDGATFSKNLLCATP